MLPSSLSVYVAWFLYSCLIKYIRTPPSDYYSYLQWYYYLLIYSLTASVMELNLMIYIFFVCAIRTVKWKEHIDWWQVKVNHLSRAVKLMRNDCRSSFHFHLIVSIYSVYLMLLFFLLILLQYGQRVPTAASPSNTNSSSSSNTGSQSGTLSTSLSNTNTNNTMGPSTTPQQTEQLSKTNLYIRGLQQGTTDKDLHNMCSQ